MSTIGRREDNEEGKHPMTQSRARVASTKTWKENNKTSDNSRLNNK